MKTKVISARVPVDIAEMIENVCKQRNVSKSTYIAEMVTTPAIKPIDSPSVVNPVNPPNELMEVLSAVGGVGVGVLTWNILQTHLPNDRFTDEQKDTISLLGSIGAGMFGFFAMDKAFKNK